MKIKITIANLFISYFRAGFSYNETVDILSSCHGKNTSARTQHRILRVHQTRRKIRIIVTNMVLNFISNELLPNRSHTEYHIMHQLIYENNIFVDRETVRITLKSMNS